MFELYGDDVKVGFADVLQGVRSQGRSPEGASDSWFRRETSAVQEHRAVTIAADEVAPTEQVIRARPLVRVQWDNLSRADERVEHANGLIFEEQRVILGCAVRASKSSACCWRSGMANCSRTRNCSERICGSTQIVLDFPLPSASWDRSAFRGTDMPAV